MGLVEDLKSLICDLKEEEQEANRAGNTGMYSGLSYARVNLESLLERHGHQRPAEISGECAQQTEALVLSDSQQ